MPEALDPDLLLRMQHAAYDRGWRDYDRGGSHAMRRRLMVRLVDDNAEALALWEAGWADNFKARGYGTGREKLLATNPCP